MMWGGFYRRRPVAILIWTSILPRTTRKESAMSRFTQRFVFFGLATALSAHPCLCAAEVVAPPNRPAQVVESPNGEIRLQYHGETIFDAVVFVKTAAGGRRAAAGEVRLVPAQSGEEKVEQRLMIAAARPADGLELVLQGAATGSDEAFAAETLTECRSDSPASATASGRAGISATTPSTTAAGIGF